MRAHRNPQIYFDMDGLTAGFHEASMRVHNLPVEPDTAPWNFYEPWLTFEQFWAPLRNEAFWADLPVMPDGKELLERLLDEVGPKRVTVLSNGFCPGSVEGKRTWLKKYFPAHVEKAALLGAEKWRCAAPCKLLVDDHDPNCELFEHHGGLSVLVPRSWNARKGEILPGGRFDVDAVFNEVMAHYNRV